MQRWDELTEEQLLEARELALIYTQQNARTLPTYEWLKRHCESAKTMPHNTLIAFGRQVLEGCKAIQRYRGIR